MARTSAYKIRIRTDSADSNSLMLFNGGELVAILVELADEGHGDDRGRWIIETTFGLTPSCPPRSFARPADAADWVSQHHRLCSFDLDREIVELI